MRAIKLESFWAIVQRCVRDPTFGRFGTTPTCDRQTDRRKDTRWQPFSAVMRLKWIDEVACTGCLSLIGCHVSVVLSVSNLKTW